MSDFGEYADYRTVARWLDEVAELRAQRDELFAATEDALRGLLYWLPNTRREQKAREAVFQRLKAAIAKVENPE